MGSLQSRFRRFKRKPGSDLMLYRALVSRFSGPLDGFDTSAFVLTTSVLFSRQLGQPMFRIRRSADDNHCDVLPDTSALINGTYFVGLNSSVQNFETSSAATNLGQFVASAGYSDPDSLGAASNAFVRTAYDPSGNARHAQQATAASQPKIVDGGVVVTENNAPTIDFTGDKFLALTNNTQFVSVFSIHLATAAFQGLLGAGNTYIHTDANIRNNVYDFNAFSNTREIYVNGAAYANESVTGLGYHLVNVNFNGSEPFGQIGANPDFNSFSPSFPKIGVMVYYNSDQSANRAAIEAKLAEIYGITLA